MGRRSVFVPSENKQEGASVFGVSALIHAIAEIAEEARPIEPWAYAPLPFGFEERRSNPVVPVASRPFLRFPRPLYLQPDAFLAKFPVDKMKLTQ